jgi:hypothetical protein
MLLNVTTSIAPTSDTIANHSDAIFAIVNPTMTPFVRIAMIMFCRIFFCRIYMTVYYISLYMVYKSKTWHMEGRGDTSVARPIAIARGIFRRFESMSTTSAVSMATAVPAAPIANPM